MNYKEGITIISYVNVSHMTIQTTLDMWKEIKILRIGEFNIPLSVQDRYFG